MRVIISFSVFVSTLIHIVLLPFHLRVTLVLFCAFVGSPSSSSVRTPFLHFRLLTFALMWVCASPPAGIESSEESPDSLAPAPLSPPRRFAPREYIAFCTSFFAGKEAIRILYKVPGRR